MANYKHTNQFLKFEWGEKKLNRITPFRSLNEFFKDQFPQIKLATEYEKDLLISKLAESTSFYMSRITLRKLAKHESFDYDNTIILGYIKITKNEENRLDIISKKVIM